MTCGVETQAPPLPKRYLRPCKVQYLLSIVINIMKLWEYLCWYWAQMENCNNEKFTRIQSIHSVSGHSLNKLFILLLSIARSCSSSKHNIELL
jgi:hypothetical protein